MTDDKLGKYVGYLTFDAGPEGEMETFHFCGTLDRAHAWRAEHAERKSKAERAETDKSATVTVEDEETNGFKRSLKGIVATMRSFYHLIEILRPVKSVFPRVLIHKEIVKYSKSNLEIISQDQKYTTYGLLEHQEALLMKRTSELKHLREGVGMLPASVLMGLVARFDASISALVRFLLVSRKERLSANDKTIAVKDVLAMSSFEDLVQQLVDHEIYQLMRGSHEDQVRYIEDNFSIKIIDGFERWPQFIEVFERRNLAAHGEGAANTRYVSVCGKARVPAEAGLKLGEPINLSDKYLASATDLLLEFGVLMIWWIWLKNAPADAELAYNELNVVTYDLISDRRYLLSARILKSALKRTTENAPEVIRRMMAVNLANCYKKLEKSVEFEDAVRMFDWTASADEFKISVASLRGDVDEVCRLMPRVKDPEVVGSAGLREWPVFDWVRSDDKFRSAFNEVFGEPIDQTLSDSLENIESGQSVPDSAETPTEGEGTLH